MKEQGARRNDVSPLFLIWAAFFVILFCSQAFGAIPASERAALIALYNSTGGDNWDKNDGWKTPPLAADGFAMPGTENTWYGITCDSSNTAVLEISQAWNNLQGTLPTELGNLANLKSLEISDCSSLTGSIPPELGTLSHLWRLDLSKNNLSCSIPGELGNLTNLTSLDLSENSLSGSIPPELDNLVNLQWLDFLGNELTGSIPPELGNLSHLWWLDLSYNNLISIPPELGNLSHLWRLDLSYNNLGGGIPPELGNLGNLGWLDLSYNNLISIPPELGNLSHLWRLDLTYNNLISIPPELGNLSRLQHLDLSYNNLGGGIPPELGNLSNLYDLYLNNNNLTGSIPPELGNLSNLYELYLNNNKLTGRIPVEIGNLTDLAILYLHGNRLSGPIPASLQNLTNLGLDYTLHFDGLCLCWNALYTNNSELRNFIRYFQDDLCDWEINQTVPPKGLTASPNSPYAVELQWKPIVYKEDPGSYRVFYSTSAQGTFRFFAETSDKFTGVMTVTGLEPGTTYYFKIQSRTYPHARNKNTVDSNFSRVVSAVTDPALFSISGTINYRGSGLPGVTLNLSNNGGTVSTGAKGFYYVQVEQGWSGTITPTKKNFMFSPALRTYAPVYSEKTNQDFTAYIPIALHISAVRKTERAFIISRDYGMVTLSMENKNNIPGIRCVLERKIKGGTFQPIKEFAGAELSGGAHVYTDTFLDRDKSYTYRLVAYDSEGNYLISPAETTI